MVVLAARPIDLAIFGTLGTLWVAGAVFIFLLYRWILRFEANERSPVSAPAPSPAVMDAQPAVGRSHCAPGTPAAQHS